eukprot:TRINITY_DN20278_c0_g1_i1.p1 TRINITY_DN20278_c0_g1~~TRINITY_DN20278_c0_g1_i1.p1  ORF type:complete len:314 (-),score=102.59 TRINITY_DN20278_c0_g1_i1:18-959(-)
MSGNGTVWLFHQSTDSGSAPKTRTDSYELKSIKYALDAATGVATATFNTPKNLNALRELQLWEMFLVLEHAAQDSAVRCLLWTAAGRAFNAGADWNGGNQAKEVTDSIPEHVRDNYLARGMGPAANNADLACKCLTLAFWDFPKPSVCAVNGLAVGGGANIALANFHDVVICSDQAKFLWPFSKLGLTPELGSTFIMPALIGIARAKEILMRNEWVSAQKALDYGLCTQVVPAEQLMQAATEIAQSFAASNLTALRLSKELLHKHLGREKLAEMMDNENEFIMQAFTSDETQALMQRNAAAKAAKKKASKSKL